MDAFHWSPAFVTGLGEVDEQHHRLVDRINRFGALVVRPGGASIAELEAVFAELAQYAVLHFTEEESLMSSARVDERHVVQHKRVHAAFLEEVTELHQGLAAQDGHAARSLLQFLTHWLAYHILGSDQLMAKQIAAIKSGSRPDEAFLAHSVAIDPATNTLLHALSGLFDQVSERNVALVQLNKTLELRVAERTQALTEANQQLEDLANTDVLTGLPNRRHALRRFASLWDAAVRDDGPLACLMIDADNFKVVNDTHGHDAGDAVLRALAKELSHSVRTDDLVVRLGGDEFLVILPATPLDGAMKLAEALRESVSTLQVPAGGGVWHGSISVGVAARTASMGGIDDAMKAADLGVYVAKRNGRNCVATAQ